MVYIGLVILALLTGIASGLCEDDPIWFRLWNALNMYVIMAATCFLVAMECL